MHLPKSILTVLLAVGLFASCDANKEIPLVFDKENTASSYSAPEMPGINELPVVETLPDPFLFSNGKHKVEKYSQWERRRAEIMAELQNYEIGWKP